MDVGFWIVEMGKGMMAFSTVGIGGLVEIEVCEERKQMG